MTMDKEQWNPADIWAKLAAPLDPEDVEWRQQGRPTERDGIYSARFVCYVEAGVVRERLDAVVPGQWSLELTELPNPEICDNDGVMDRDQVCAFKARLTVLGVAREDVGVGKDYKQASTDAFKRASVRFGIGHELYAMEGVWVKVDGGGKFAKPLEDPSAVYRRKHPDDKNAPRKARPVDDAAPSAEERSGVTTEQLTEDDGELCPKCGGHMWDNRTTKRNPKAPDWKCRDRACDGVIWPAKKDEKAEQTDALEGQGTPVPGTSTTRTLPPRGKPAVKGPPPDNGKRLPGETDADVAGQPKVDPPARAGWRDTPALLDEDDDLPF